jgi:general secretion pathway protein A
MYTRYYGLREEPFTITPDSHFFYLSTQHREALGHLLYGIRERKGFILISGEVGAGKTTLCRAMVREIAAEAEVGVILNSFLSAKELLKAINDDLVGSSRGRTKKELVDELNAFLLEKHASGRSVVLLIDECQNLAPGVLEQLRMLSNLETEKQKLLQIVLVGQPEILEKLESRGLRQLSQRIGVSFHLKPLNYGETVGYIYHRLGVARGNGTEVDGNGRGGLPLSFSRPALKIIYAYSEGIPRKVNIVCDRALLIGFVKGKRKITARIVKKAIGEISSGRVAGKRRARWRVKGPWLTVGVSLLVFLLAYILSGFVRTVAPGGERTAQDEVLTGTTAEETIDGRESLMPQESRNPVDEPPPVESGAAVPAPVTADFEAPAVKQLPPSEVGAAQLLGGVWGCPVPEEGALNEGDAYIYDYARAVRMTPFNCWGSGRFLRAMNMPCIVPLRKEDSQGRSFGVISAVNDRGFVVNLNGDELCISETEMEKMLCGAAVYFLPQRVKIPPLLSSGSRGEAVGRLQRRLRRLGIFSGKGDGYYGEETVTAVKALQRDYGLPQDGIAGRNEHVLLQSLLAGAVVPRLL